jgi:hypothetical protein
MVGLLSQFRGLSYAHTKMAAFKTALDMTASAATSSSGQFNLDISRSRASNYYHDIRGMVTGAGAGIVKHKYRTDHDGRYAVFSQAFRFMQSMPPEKLRSSSGQLYNVRFMGENAVDAGGPYRESFSMFCQELQSAALPLMVATANSKNEIGINRDRWVLNPAAISATNMEMFSFFGKLMGIAIRSQEYLALNIPSLIWYVVVAAPLAFFV